MSDVAHWAPAPFSGRLARQAQAFLAVPFPGMPRSRARRTTAPVLDETSPSTGPLLDFVGFLGWLATAEPGTRIAYHRGFLACDVDRLMSRLAASDRHALELVADNAMWAADQALVHLVQKRLGPDCFTYLAIARPRSRSSEALLAEFLDNRAAA